MSSPFLSEYNYEKERQLAREEAAMLGREEGQAEEKKRTVEPCSREITILKQLLTSAVFQRTLFEL